MQLRIHRNHAVFVVASFGLALLPLHAGAAGLTGTSVTGTLTFSGGTTNYYDPANGFVPSSGYLNASSPTVTIASPAVEFGFNDNVNLDFANFSASQFTIEDVVETGPANAPFTMTFTDAAFSGMAFAKVSDSFTHGGLTATLVGNKVTINWAGGTVTAGDDYTSTFTMVPVPEPSTWALAGLGAAALALATRRQFRAQA